MHLALGIKAVLMQGNRPVAYFSMALIRNPIQMDGQT
jgi:hypothetical protein